MSRFTVPLRTIDASCGFNVSASCSSSCSSPASSSAPATSDRRSPATTRHAHRLDHVLRFDQVQVLASHNSYKLALYPKVRRSC